MNLLLKSTLLVIACYGVDAIASPIGTSYFLALDAIVTDGVTIGVEGHSNLVPFDGLVDPLLSDVGLSPPFLPGNDLDVTETFVPVTPLSDSIRIQVDAPTGETLFVNSFAPGGSVFLALGDLYWQGPSPTVLVTNVRVEVDDGAGPAAVQPIFMDVLGLGTELDPLAVELEFDASTFGQNARSLVLTIDLVVPEPGSLLLASVGMLGLAIIWRRR